MLIDADQFPAQLPNFNSKGKVVIKSYFGGCVSIVLYYFLFLFSIVKFQHMMTRHNPQIVMYDEIDALDSRDVYRPAEAEGFMVAIGFVHFLTGAPLNDPRYVKWVNMFSNFGSGGF